MNRNPMTTIRLAAAAILAAGFLVPFSAVPAMAQASDGATASMSVTVEAPAVNVVFNGNMTFGTHFASAGTVSNSLAARWNASVDDATESVDYTVTQLPTSLSDGSGNTVPLTYGTNSLSAQCFNSLEAVQTFWADPTVGLTDCRPVGTGTNVWIGNDTPQFTDDSEFVQVDLTGAPPGTYTGTLELTATLN